MEGGGHRLTEVRTQHFPGGIQETISNLPDSLCPDKTRTKRLPRSSQDRYGYANPLRRKFQWEPTVSIFRVEKYARRRIRVV
jgi:hypothetical protein